MLKTTARAAVVVPDNVLFLDNREASKDPWTKEVGFYGYRTNTRHALKKEAAPLRGSADFVE